MNLAALVCCTILRYRYWILTIDRKQTIAQHAKKNFSTMCFRVFFTLAVFVFLGRILLISQ